MSALKPVVNSLSFTMVALLVGCGGGGGSTTSGSSGEQNGSNNPSQVSGTWKNTTDTGIRYQAEFGSGNELDRNGIVQATNIELCRANDYLETEYALLFSDGNISREELQRSGDMISNAVRELSDYTSIAAADLLTDYRVPMPLEWLSKILTAAIVELSKNDLLIGDAAPLLADRYPSEMSLWADPDYFQLDGSTNERDFVMSNWAVGEMYKIWEESPETFIETLNQIQVYVSNLGDGRDIFDDRFYFGTKPADLEPVSSAADLIGHQKIQVCVLKANLDDPDLSSTKDLTAYTMAMYGGASGNNIGVMMLPDADQSRVDMAIAEHFAVQFSMVDINYIVPNWLANGFAHHFSGHYEPISSASDITFNPLNMVYGSSIDPISHQVWESDTAAYALGTPYSQRRTSFGNQLTLAYKTTLDLVANQHGNILQFFKEGLFREFANSGRAFSIDDSDGTSFPSDVPNTVTLNFIYDKFTIVNPELSGGSINYADFRQNYLDFASDNFGVSY